MPDTDPSTGSVTEAFDDVAAVADAVLFEGYLLYPYRASAQKNKVRWQWGVLVPQGYGADSGETSVAWVGCLVEPRRPDAEIHLRLRFLRVQHRAPQDAEGRDVDVLDVGGTRHIRFEEGITQQVDAVLPLARVREGATVPVAVTPERTVEELAHPDGSPAGRVLRTSAALSGTVTLRADEVPGPYDVLRLHLEVRNDTVAPPGRSRDEALSTALIGVHAMLAVVPGSFLSPTDPPEWAAALVADCAHEGLWPALAGPPERSDLLLCSPIILSDHQQLAPESTVDLFDGLENDEILTLRTMVLTEAEKAEARATDPRAAGIVDAVDALPPEMLERLHGAIRSLRGGGRDAGTVDDGVPTFVTPSLGSDSPETAPPQRVPWWDPAADTSVHPESDSVLVRGIPVARGSAVLLRPGPGADAQDAFLVGMAATVQAVVHDVDGGVHVAVSVDGDPAAELQLAHGRFRYFRPDELEPVR